MFFQSIIKFLEDDNDKIIQMFEIDFLSFTAQMRAKFQKHKRVRFTQPCELIFVFSAADSTFLIEFF